MITKLTEMLTREGVRFEVIPHRSVFTAQERAAACHLSGRMVAKVVVVHDETDDWFGLAVLPAAGYLDVPALRETTGRPRLRLAGEREFARLFPDCDVGAMPPFGRLYGGLDVFLDRALAEAPELICEAGVHNEELRIGMKDYLQIERPDVVPLTARRKAA
ncbi:MAG: YbaK/EbsC family protein [Candidatus Rokubacteria bacterium]|nr:YbaK/EbsC family protein [Candidatus Rokubacteria bacterium]